METDRLHEVSHLGNDSSVGNHLWHRPGVGGSLVSLLLFLALLLGRLISRRIPSRRSLAWFFAAVLIAPVLAGCPLPRPNQLVFYMISPTKAIMMHQASFDTAPGITILEQ